MDLKKNIGVLVAAISLLLFAGCGGKPAPEAYVSISPVMANVAIGESRTFTVTTQNTDFMVSAPEDSGCVESGENTVICTPAEEGLYAITITATADPTKQETAKMWVASPETIKLGEEVNERIEETVRRRQQRQQQ